jgi:cytochrome c oxidase subunit 2
MIVVAAIGTAILLAIVLSIGWFPTHASAQINRTSTLYDVLLVASVPIFVIVETVVVFCVWKFRMRPGEELKDGPPIHGNTRLEVVWTAIPAVLMFSLAGYAYTVLRANEANKRGAMIVNVTARQFAFEFTYPHQDGKTVVSPILYLPKNRPVVFKIRSYDVVHSFFVPQFAEKIDAVPGITTTLRVTPTRLGVYPAECTELCGPGHSFMRAQVRVVTPTSFQTWLSKQPNNGPPPIGVAPPSNGTSTTHKASHAAGSSGGGK